METTPKMKSGDVRFRHFEEVVGNLLLSTGSAPCFHRLSHHSACETIPTPTELLHKKSRKRMQVESMLNCANLFLKDNHVVVDFGGGTGHLSIPLALRRPSVFVLCIDIKKESLDILHDNARQRCEHGGAPTSTAFERQTNQSDNVPLFLNDKRVTRTAIPNLFTLHGSVQSFDLPFDIGLALHLCGEGTDHALRSAARHRAAIVAAPCCVGKLSTKRSNPYVFQTTGENAATISYPQSQLFRRAMNRKSDSTLSEDWNALAKAADYSDIDCIRTSRNAVRRTAKALLERDRQCFLQEVHSYESFLIRMQPWEATPKNDIIVAWHPAGATPSAEDLAGMIVDDDCGKDLEHTRHHLFEMPSQNEPKKTLIINDEVDWTKEEELEVEQRLGQFLSDVAHARDPFAEHLEIPHCRNRKMVHAVAERLGLLHWSQKKNVVVSQPVVTKGLAENFNRDGVVVIRNVMTEKEIDSLKAGIAWNIANPSERASSASADDDPGLFFEDFCNWERIPEYKAIMTESRLPRVAAKLMQSKVVRIYHDHLLVKEARTKQQTPWHQDQPYYNIAGTQNVSFWIPVDPVPIESSLQFVAGSHCRQWFLPRTFLTKEAKWFPEGSLPDIPVIDRSSTLSWALEPGDVIAFHMQTIHGSVGSLMRRRAFAARYVGDDTRHIPRPWVTSPEFPPELKGRLSKDSPLADPLFPIVFPKSKCLQETSTPPATRYTKITGNILAK